MRKFIKFAAIGAALALTAFGGVAQAKQLHFVYITHGADSDSWFNVIKNAINLAAKQMDVTVDYRNPPTGDLAQMARIVQQATASHPDGIVTTIADFDVLKGPITAAVDQGIPVITVNSGTIKQSKELGALLHIGQPEYAAGKAAGERAKKAGVTHFLCVNHYITNPASVERCQGFADGLGVPLGNQMIDSGMDPSQVKNKVEAYLTAHSETNGILTLGPNSADPTIAALDDMGKSGEIYFGTFDLDPAIAKAIKSGVIAFAIDQQPFLQGYLPIVLLANYDRYGVIPPNSINSGPGFITKATIGQVQKLAGTYR